MLIKLLITLILSLSFIIAPNSFADDKPRYNNVFFYKNYKGSNQSLLALAENMSQSGDYEKVKNSHEIYLAILGNSGERFTKAERAFAKKKIKEVFFWDCDFNVSCTPVPQKLDASLKNINFEKPFYNPEKWGVTQHQLENLDFSMALEIVKPQYRYKELISEAQKGDIAAMIIASGFFRGSGIVQNQQDLEAEYLKTAADLGNAFAMGRYAFDAEPSNPITKQERDNYLQKAADLGDANSLVRLSVKSNNKKEKLQYLLKAAEKNSVIAFSGLGYFYYNEGDYDAAFKWRKKAFDNREGITILPEISFMLQESIGFFDNKKNQEWISKIESTDNTVARFRILEVEKMNVHTPEEKQQNWRDYMKLAGVGGYGSVLAAELLENWYGYAVYCKPKGDMAYECFERQ